MNKENKTVLQVVAAMDQGGVEQGTHDMAIYIKQQGWKSMVASNGGRMTLGLTDKGIKHFRMPLKKRNPLAILCNAQCLIKIIKKHNVDILHTRSRAPAWAALIASRATGVPLITSFHGTHKIQNKAKWIYNSVMVKGVFTIANSQFIWGHIIKNYRLPKNKLRLAPRGVDPSVFNRGNVTVSDKNALRDQWQLGESPIILMPGRLTRWKGQAVFIEALAEIKDMEWKALIVGGADKKKKYAKQLKTLVKKYKLEDRVIFTGGQSNLAPYYALARVTVSASTEPEAFGRVAIESQAMATPVVATAHGGSLETVKEGETGFLVPPGDSRTMAKMLRQVMLDANESARMGDNGYHWVQNNFTISLMCKKEFDVYREVLKQK